MLIPTPPTPYTRPLTYQVADNPSFTGAQSMVYDPAHDRWSINLATIHTEQLDPVATAIERLFLQDFSAPLEIDRLNIDPKVDTDGVTVLNPGFEVSLDQIADAPNLFTIAGYGSVSVGMAWSLRTLIRVTMGIGTPYAP